MRLRAALTIGLAAALAVAGCSGDTPGDAEADDTSPATTRPEPVTPTVTLPAEPTAVLGGASPDALAIEASQLLFEQSPLAVLVAADDDASGAAAIAVELGVPLLVGPPESAPTTDQPTSPSDPPATTSPTAETGDATMDELARLQATTVLSVGAGAAAFVAQLPPDITVVEAPDGAAAVDDLPDDALPVIAQPDAPPTFAALTVSGSDATAAAATVQAAGGVVHELAAPDPRTDSAVIAALADLQPDVVIGIGAAFGAPETFANRVSVAKTGVELPGGGQVLYPYHRHVALYGNPTSPALGSLGEQSPAASVVRVQTLAAEYQEFTDQTVVPTFEVISSVASASPSSGGDYSTEMTPDELRPYIDAARDAGIYVVLDLQPGRSDFLTQAKLYEEFLKEPFVGLALDPEWRLTPTQVHLEQVGRVGVAEVNSVVTWLADLTAANNLPQKLLILHQFRTIMITDRGQVDTSRDEVAVLIHVDGFGPTGSKFATWNAIRADPPPNVWWGWKNFIDEDSPLMTPEQTMAVDPVPQFVSYQ